MIEWIRDLYQYFDYEEIEEDKKVKLVVTRLKGHAHYGGIVCRLR